MKRFLPNKKGFFALLLALSLCSGTAYAYDFSTVCSTGQTLYYNITDVTNHYVQLVAPGGNSSTGWDGYTKPTGNIALPSTVSYNGITYTVKTIGNFAFYECSGLTGSLTIPNSVTTIGVSAFYECSGLTGSLTIPNSVTNINGGAFASCSGFNGTLTIPSSVTTLGGSVFTDCSGFTHVNYKCTNCANASQYNPPFENCEGTLTIGNNVTRIPSYMFKDSNFTGSLTIPNSVTAIGASAFASCTGFTGSLTLGNSVTTIDSWAFCDCTGFTGSLTIPNSVTSIGIGGFQNCSGLTGSLTILNSVTAIGNSAFSGCSGLTGSLTIPNSVTEIGNNAFYGCDGFTSLTLGSSVTSIGISTFSGCSGFTGSLTIPNSVIAIGNYAFYNCTGFMGSLNLGNSVTTIGTNAFRKCTGFTGSLIIGSNVTTIGDYAFYDANFTGTLTIPNSVTEIGNQAFYSCDGFTSLTLGSSVTSIGNYAFSCSGLTSMTVLPETPPSLGTFVFDIVPKTIPVYVPFGTLSTYQSASGWSAFTNMQEYCDNLTYSINPDGVSVTVTGHVDGTSATGSLFIPETKTINGVTYAVTKIGDDAFSNCSGLTGSLTIPNSVTAIGDYAFYYCSGFTGSLNIPNSVTLIGNNAFDRCTGFTGSLTIGNSVTSIGDYAFYFCSGFTGSLTIPNSVTSIGIFAFRTCSGFTGTLTIPNSVTTISDEVFCGCYGFTGSLTIPNSVTTIGDYAFLGCDGFTGSLTIPNSVTSIGDYAFLACSGFTGSLTIPNSVTSIGDDAFCECSGFTGSLTIPNSVTTISYEVFYGCSGFTGTLTIPNSVTSIGTSAFKNCSGFTQVNYNATNCADVTYTEKPFEGCGGTLTIGSNVTKIPAYMFSSAGFTGSLTIPNPVTTIGEGAFYSCEGFTGSLTIGNSVTEIGANAFTSCTGFTGSLTIGNHVTTIGVSAFSYCNGFTGTLTIPNSVTSIGYQAFKGCSSFTQVKYNAINCADVNSAIKPFEGCGGTLTIGSNVTRIPAYMFSSASFTGSLSMTSSVTMIGNGAFEDCSGFTGTLNVANVTSIGTSAFKNCSGFTGGLVIPNTMTTIGAQAFRNCSGLSGSLFIGNSVTTIGQWAFGGCSGLTGSLTIGSSVTSIGVRAFENCSGLTSMTVHPETPPTLSSYAFRNVPTTIPIYVPCSAVDDYQSVSGWSEFTNYQCKPVVTVTAVPTAGGTVTGGGTYTNGATCTVTATPNPGYQFMNWSKDGTVVSTDSSCWFTVTEDTELEAVFMPNAGIAIGEGDYKSEYLPSYSYYNYSMTEQLYTASEIGNRIIYSISFFNAGHTETRNYDIYMKRVTKTSFSSATDWVSVSSSNLVFSGTVTMKTGQWTTILLDTPYSFYSPNNNHCLLIAVDDNTGDYTNAPHMSCRTYAAEGNQTLRIYSDGTNYNPSSPSSYSGTLMVMKNQIILNRTVFDITATSANTSEGTVSGGGIFGYGDLCRLTATAKSGYTFVDWVDELGTVASTDANYSFIVTGERMLTARFISDSNVCRLTFDLHDSYGNGWNGNQLVVNYQNGMTEKLTVPYGEYDATFTLPVVDGSHVELGWIEGNYADRCSFEVRYSDGSMLYVGRNLDSSFEYEFDMDCAGQSVGWTYIGDHSTANNYYLPSWSYFSYGLSEQIYTADEIGTAGIINGIAFYNEGTQTRTRSYDIYLKRTDKTAFESPTDWIGASDAQLVYSGDVTMISGTWTPIAFTYPFEYDGVSNLVLIVDDNTADYTEEPYISCLVYPSDGLQALRVSNDDINYDPNDPFAFTGTLQSVKNQIQLDITSACLAPFDLEATDITSTSANINWNLANESFELQYCKIGPNNDFGNSFGLWTTIDADGDGYNWFYSHSVGHDGSAGLAESASWDWNTDALTPDNYLVSPRITLGGSISFWARAEDEYFAAEHFGVAVSTTGNTNAADFTIIQEWTMTAKGEGSKAGHSREGDTRNQGNWYQYTVNLSAYSGQGYVAIRHFNCTNMFRLDVDDITVVQPGVNSSWTTVSDVTNPYTLTGLTPATHYEVRVRSNCGGNQYSGWAYTDFTTMSVQTVALTAGWNWWSTDRDITLDDLKAALVTTGNTSITIKSKTSSTTYNGVRWRGNLNALDVTQMYMIHVNTACEIELSGSPLVPAEHPITIKNGPNWIGFPLNSNMSLTNAFAGFAVNGDVVKSKTSNATYNGTRWRGALTTLEPGQGYIYNSSATQNRTLVFPASTR